MAATITVVVPDYGTLILPDDGRGVEALRRALIQQYGLSQLEGAPVEEEQVNGGKLVKFSRRAGGAKA